MRKLGFALAGVVLLVAATVTDAIAGDVQVVPELNPSSVAGGLALLAGGVLLLRARFSK